MLRQPESSRANRGASGASGCVATCNMFQAVPRFVLCCRNLAVFATASFTNGTIQVVTLADVREIRELIEFLEV